METKPWRDKDKLQTLHQDRGLSGRQMAPILGCSAATATRWLNKYSIFTPVTYFTTPDKGYEKWRNGEDSVYVHRLLAVAEHGYDAVAEKRIHHKNGIPWDNRPENIEPLTRTEHQGKHKKAQGKERKAIAYAYEFTNMSSYAVAETCDYTPNSVMRIHKEYFD